MQIFEKICFRWKPYFLDINTQIQSLKEKGNREKGRIKVGEEKSIQIKLRNIKKKAKGKEYTKKRKK